MSVANPENKDEDQNAIPPETDWPNPIYHHRRWPLKLKENLNILGIYFGYFIALILFFGIIFLLIDISRLYFDSDNPNQLNELRSSLFILATFLGAPFLIWRLLLTSEQTKTAAKKANAEEKQVKIAQKQAEVEQDNHYASKYTNAKTQLHSLKSVGKNEPIPNIEVRIDGLYTLERFMHLNDKDTTTIIETLTTYVKDNCGKEKPFDFKTPERTAFKNISSWLEAIKATTEAMKKKADTFKKDAPSNRVDINIALKIIGQRPTKFKTKKNMPDLSLVNLQGGGLSGVDLSFCNLRGAHMQGANMRGINMFGTDIQRAKIQGADMQMAILQGANMHAANMQGANLQGANIQEAKITSAEMQGANMQEANVQRTNFHLSKMQWTDLRWADMRGVDLGWVEMHEANMQGVDLQRAKMQGTKMNFVDMQNVNIQGANVKETNKYKSQTQQSSRLQGETDYVRVTDAVTTAASVIWVDFTESKHSFSTLQSKVTDMFGHKTETLLPEGMKVPDHWSEADMDTADGRRQYNRDWEAFKKEKGVE